MPTYYVAPTGNDGNTNVQAQNPATPWRTWQKGASVLLAGDTLFLRGGTYVTTFAPGASDWQITWQNLIGNTANHITISAFPGEVPVMDFAGFLQTNNTTGLRMNNASFVDITGIRLVNLLQNPAVGNIIAGVEFHDCNDITLTNCAVDNIGGAGWRQSVINGSDTRGCNNFTWTNCDASRCADPISTGGGQYGNADGFDANGVTTYINCRAWRNSDDGFDAFNNDSMVNYRGCWSFWNGFGPPGTFTDPGAQADGMGFKLGGSGNVSTAHLRNYTRCLAFQNKAWGFDQNQGRPIAWFYNNTSFNNGFMNTSTPGGGGGWATGYNLTPRTNHIIKNCISFQDPTTVSDPTGMTIDHNTFTPNPATAATPSAASFLSIDPTGMDGARAADGSLPVLNFLRLSSGSNMIDKGITDANTVSLGLVYNGIPDLGAYEFSSAPPSNGARSRGFIIV